MKKRKLVLCLFTLLIFGLVSSCKKDQKDTEKEPVTKDCNCAVEVALPNVKAEIITFGKGDKQISIEKKGEAYILGGDMVLTQEQVNFLKNKYEKPSGPVTESAVALGKLWPGGVVYYTIDPSLTNSYRVTEAMAHWAANTTITFVARTTQTNYVKFANGNGCSSNIGMVGGEQIITLQSTCSTGNTIHEIGHAVGLFHEQTRNDRDDYITINMNNIQAGKEYNFQRYAGTYAGTDVGDFDLGSIMMYGPYDFSKNGQPTITKKDGTTYPFQRESLSYGDIAGVKFLYLKNPNGLPYATIEFDNISSVGSHPPLDLFSEYADYYISFYTTYANTVPVIPNASIIFKYTSIESYSNYFSGGNMYGAIPVTGTVQNTNGLTRIFLGRFPHAGTNDLEDPQWGQYTETYFNNFYVDKGSGYNVYRY